MYSVIVSINCEDFNEAFEVANRVADMTAVDDRVITVELLNTVTDVKFPFKREGVTTL